MNKVPSIGSAEALAVKRILLINVTRIGDTLLNTPAIRAIHRWSSLAGRVKLADR